jgi:DNA-3-methyladenine glycosylase
MTPYRLLPKSFYLRQADEVARDLLGRYLCRQLGAEQLVLRIVETEAYLGASDRASHAWGDRRTDRTSALFRPGGAAYVYFIYGVHHMLNVVTGSEEDGSAVLIRAGEPVAGDERMRRLRGLDRPPRPGDLAGGPGKLCRALAIDGELNRAPLYRGELRLTAGAPVSRSDVAVGPRIGVDYAGEAAHWPLRFAEVGNPHVSRPRPD